MNRSMAVPVGIIPNRLSNCPTHVLRVIHRFAKGDQDVQMPFRYTTDQAAGTAFKDTLGYPSVLYQTEISSGVEMHALHLTRSL